jgi:hypothetical protein
MEYFCLSSFYERNSINQKCISQKIDFKTKKYGLIGLEFNVETINNEKDLFIISKSYRKSVNDLDLISYYYVFKGTIFQSPNLFSIITSNLESISNNINSLILELNDGNCI